MQIRRPGANHNSSVRPPQHLHALKTTTRKTTSSESHPPIRQILPLLLSKGLIRVRAWSQPQEDIISTLLLLCPNLVWIYSLLPQRHLVLLVVMDMRAPLHNPQEHRNRISRQRVACMTHDVRPVRVGLAQNHCSTTGSTFVAGHSDAVYVRLYDVGMVTECQCHLSGGYVLRFPGGEALAQPSPDVKASKKQGTYHR